MRKKMIAGVMASLCLASGQAWAGDCNVDKLAKGIKTYYEVSGTVTCAVAGAAFIAACEGGSLGLATPVCIPAGVSLDAACALVGVPALANKAHAVAGDICDYVGALEQAPAVLVQNKLKEHRVDFRVAVKHGDDVHQRGSDWLDPGKTNILSSNKLEKGKEYTVKATIKRDGKKDEHREISGVTPDNTVVSMEYQDGDYKLLKQRKEFKKK